MTGYLWEVLVAEGSYFDLKTKLCKTDLKAFFDLWKSNSPGELISKKEILLLMRENDHFVLTDDIDYIFSTYKDSNQRS